MIRNSQNRTRPRGMTSLSRRWHNGKFFAFVPTANCGMNLWRASTGKIFNTIYGPAFYCPEQDTTAWTSLRNSPITGNMSWTVMWRAMWPNALGDSAVYFGWGSNTQGSLFEAGTFNSSYKLSLHIYYASSEEYGPGGGTLQPGVWYDHAMSYDAVNGVFRGYINGVKEKEQAFGPMNLTASKIEIGATAYITHVFEQYLIYAAGVDRVLSDADIALVADNPWALWEPSSSRRVWAI